MRIEIHAETADEKALQPEPKVYSIQGPFIFASNGGNYMHGDVVDAIAQAEKASAILRAKLTARETVVAIAQHNQAIAEAQQIQAMTNGRGGLKIHRD